MGDNPNIELIHLDDFDLFIDHADLDIGHPISILREYEPHVAAVVRRLLKSGDVFVDVGANIGYFTMLAARLVGGGGRVVAVEPNVRNTRLIHLSALANNFDNVIIYPLAAGDCERTLQLLAYSSNGEVINPTGLSGEMELVQGVDLDRLLASESRVDCIKIDIEGYEPTALRGMRKTISKHQPVIISEFHPWILSRSGKSEDYLQALIQLGYRLSVIDRWGDVVETPDIMSIMDYWRSANLRADMGDRLHLDLLCCVT